MKVAVFFPGYGSQFLGMGKNLYDDERLVQEYFEEASACTSINFVKLCFASSEAELAKMNNAYLANLVLGYAIFALLKAEEIQMDLLTGENIGAFTALACAGAMTFPDALYLLNKYATTYQEFLDTHDMSMLSVYGVDQISLEKLCKKASSADHQVYISVVKSISHVMVGGHTVAMDRLKELIDLTYDAKYKDEDCAHELHSVLMTPVVETLKPYLVKVDIKDMAYPVVRSIDGTPIKSAAEVAHTMVARITQPIFPVLLFEQMAQYDLVIQIGPGSAIAQTLQKQYPHKAIIAVNQRSEINEIKKYIQSQLSTEK